MPKFISGLDLSRQFYQGCVGPALAAGFPGVAHSAALIGRGSEVLGYDDEMSRDHDWGPRVVVFLRDDDLVRVGDAVNEMLSRDLPAAFLDYPASVTVVSIRGYFLKSMDIDIDADISARDWLTMPEQQLRMVVAGEVFHDEIGLQTVRDRFAYYPHDVWLYLLVAGWWRVHPEANLIGRVGFVGDELGSALIGSRLALDLMKLCFLMERKYAPYSKWFATAFSQLGVAAELSPILLRILGTQNWNERETALIAAYDVVARLHESLRITGAVPVELHQIWGRPFKVRWGDFPGALSSEIQDPEVTSILERWPAGGVDQLRDLMPGPRSRRLLLRVTD